MKIKQVWKWLRKNIFNKEMILYVLIAELIFWSPVIIFSILAIIINPYFWGIVSGIILFWAGPFTPAMPLQFALAVAIKKLFERGKTK